MKKFISTILLYFVSLTSVSLAQQSMIPLKDYISKNNTDDVAVQSYILNRCAAVNLYISVLNPNAADKSVATRTQKNYELFAELNFTHLTTKGKMKNNEAQKNIFDNIPPMSKAYGDDGQANFVKTGEYTTGYIFEDFQICNKFLK
jgi:hypothetical protein